MNLETKIECDLILKNIIGFFQNCPLSNQIVDINLKNLVVKKQLDSIFMYQYCNYNYNYNCKYSYN